MMYRKKGFATLVPHNMTELQVTTLGSSGKAGDKHWMIDMNTNMNRYEYDLWDHVSCLCQTYRSTEPIVVYQFENEIW